MVCAGLDQGRDPCQPCPAPSFSIATPGTQVAALKLSDSGGPLVCDETLQGILSWGVYPCGSAQRPAVYTNLCKYVSWIERTIRSK
ncbi:hypothetical protein MC885_012455 [Smutsia gigantea]|nr:hypothetical protein MC885_012455 [Smutsia gigantea]